MKEGTTVVLQILSGFGKDGTEYSAAILREDEGHYLLTRRDPREVGRVERVCSSDEEYQDLVRMARALLRILYPGKIIHQQF